MKQWKAELSLVMVTFIWGGTFLFTKFGLNFTTPGFYLMIRFSIAFLLSLMFFFKYLKNIEFTTFKHGTLLGFLFGCGFLFQTYGLQFTTVSKSAFITGMIVPVTPFVYKLLEKRKVPLWSKIGVIIASIGLLLFTNPQFDALNNGDILTLISTFFWAFYITYLDIFTKNTNGIQISAQFVFLQFLSALPTVIIAFFIFDLRSFHLVINQDLIISLAYNGIIASFLVTLIHTSVQKFTNPIKAALIFALEPIIATALAVLTINEIINLREFTGGMLMLLGVLASEIGSNIFLQVKQIFIRNY